MTEPTPLPPLNDQSIAGRLIDALNAYRPIIKDLVIVLGVLATLGTSVYTSCQATKHGEQLDKNLQVGEQTKDIATAAKKTQTAVAEATKDLAADRLGENAPAVKNLEATTRPATQSETK